MDDGPAHDLPSPLTDFVGRVQEIADVAGRLAAGARLVTVTGAGGSGKTRLAIQVARRVLPDHGGGACFVDLAPLAEPAFMPQAIAAALGVREEPDRPLTDSLIRALSGEPRLLLLDNCEHLVEACAGVAETLLRACPRLKILATSRESLNVAGEDVWPIPPLSLPPPGGAAPEGLLESDAVGLFVRRGRAVQQGFALTERNAAAVARVCRRLDGLPLAIELAAARLRVLSVAEILERLDDRFRLLTGGSRTAPQRQQTLWATLAWSYDLLPDQERILFDRLSIFAGACTLAGAEAVCAERPLARADVLDLLTRLIDKSLVVAEQDGEGRTRYRLLESVREFGRAKLNAGGELAGVQARHAHHFIRVAEAAESDLRGLGQARWLDRLEAEHGNFRAALRWCLEPGADRGALGVRLAAALQSYWRIRGHAREARDATEALLGLPAAAGGTVSRSRIVEFSVLAGWTHDAVGGPERLDSALVEGQAAARRLGDAVSAVRLLGLLARRAHEAGGEETAGSLLAEGLALAEREGLAEEAAGVLRQLGRLARDRGDDAAAVRHLEASLARYRAAGNLDGVAGVLNLLGYIRRAQGELAAARALHLEALAIWRGLGYGVGAAGATRGLGEVDFAQGALPAARGRFEESAAILRAHDVKTMLPYALVNLSLVACATGDAATARGHLAEAIALRRALGSEREVAETIEEFAGAAAGRGRASEAFRLAGAATALRRAAGQPRPPPVQARIDRALAAARRALGPAAAAAATAAGEALALDEAIDLAAGAATAGAVAAPSKATTPAAQGHAGHPAGPGAPVAGPGSTPWLRIDHATCEVWRGGEPLPRRLSAQELRLLRYLEAHGERACTRGELGDATWGAHNWDPNMLHRLVRRLREKLEPEPARPRYLHTIPGIGYRLTAGA
jgi:predicted ATPase